MSLESRKHMLETPRSPAAKAAVTTVAEVSSTNGVFAQMSPPPPRIFVSRPQQARSTSSQLPSTPPRRRTRADLTRPAYPARNPRRATPWASNDAHYPHGPSLDGRCARWAGNTLTQRRNNDDSHQ